MIPNIDKYLPFLDKYDWSREEKIEMIHAVWRMMEAHADTTFGLNPVQLSCAQNKNIASQSPVNTLSSKGAFTQQFRPLGANDDTTPATSTKGDEHAA